MPEVELDERTLRGIPLWLLQEYLQELGGNILEDGHIEGAGWEVHLKQADDFQLGSLRIGQVYIRLEAGPAIMDEIIPLLEKKLLRAGG